MSDPATADSVEKARLSNIWKRDPLDYYVEPRWCSERLFDEEKFDGQIVDPACGSGRIVDAARERGFAANGFDIEDRGKYSFGLDFLREDWPTRCMLFGPSNIVSNPPYRHAEEFVRKSLALASGKVAMLLPATWMNGARRSEWLEMTPLCRVWIITPRPSMPPGAAIEAGEKPGGGKVDFAWFVWLRGYDGAPELRWLRRGNRSA